MSIVSNGLNCPYWFYSVIFIFYLAFFLSIDKIFQFVTLYTIRISNLSGYLIKSGCFAGLGQLGQGGMGMSGFGQSLGQLGQQSTGSLGSSLGLGNSGLPISSPSQAVYQASYGLNSLGKLILYMDYRKPTRNSLKSSLHASRIILSSSRCCVIIIRN